MPLTSGVLVFVLTVAVIAGTVALTFGVPRIRNPWLARATRLGEVLVLNVLVLTLAGAALNDNYLWYADWSDLFSGSAQTTTLHVGGPATQPASVQPQGRGFGAWKQSATLPPLAQPGSRLQEYTMTGRTSGLTRKVLVYLPAGYTASPSRDYPVIVALHGFPGNPMSWMHPIHFNAVLDAAVAAHTLAPPIVVMPQIDHPITFDSECTDAPAGLGPRVETFLSADVPSWVVAHFHTIRARSAWAVMGYSLGGFCAGVLAMHHPDVFGAGILLIPYFRPDFSNYVPFARWSAAFRRYDLIHLAATAPPPVALWILASKADSLSYATTSAFVTRARSPMSVTAKILLTGGHRDQIFMPYLPEMLHWLASTLTGFAPSHTAASTLSARVHPMATSPAS